MPTLSLYDVDRETYDSLNVLEMHGRTVTWKSIWVKDLQIVFHPGDWRRDGPLALEDTSQAAF